MNNIDYTEIFVPGGIPEHTYNPRERLGLEEKLNKVFKNFHKLTVITGHTKSGKTVLVKEILKRKKLQHIWIDGGGIDNEDDFWTVAVNKLDLFQTTEVGKSTEESTEVGLEGSVEGGLPGILKGSVQTNISDKTTRGGALHQVREISTKTTALAGLEKALIPLIIDDFHYLSREIQGNVIRSLKPLVFSGLPVIIIAIPHRRYDALRVEKEMTARIFPIGIPLWSEDDLSFIPKTGFNMLGIKYNIGEIDQLSKESIGSPHLMQDFCHEISSKEPHKLSPDLITDAFEQVAETIGRPIFERLARGPRQRSDRKIRKLKDNKGKVDIYGLVLYGLSYIKPGLETLEYESLRSAIKEICIIDDVPNIQEVARVLKVMSEIASSDLSSTPVIDFDEENKCLHITDPFFAFYLRWGKIDQYKR